MIVGAFLQPPGLPLLRGRVVAVVVQQEGPHLAADGWVDATEEDRLGKEMGGKKSDNEAKHHDNDDNAVIRQRRRRS